MASLQSLSTSWVGSSSLESHSWSPILCNHSLVSYIRQESIIKAAQSTYLSDQYRIKGDRDEGDYLGKEDLQKCPCDWANCKTAGDSAVTQPTKMPQHLQNKRMIKVFLGKRQVFPNRKLWLGDRTWHLAFASRNAGTLWFLTELV